jgi:hypothetical protein
MSVYRRQNIVVSQNTLEIKLFDTLIVFRTTHD